MSRLCNQFPLLIVLLLWGASLGAGSLLTMQSTTESSGKTAGSTYILGPARSLLSAGLYHRADQYFHKGAPPTKKEAFQSIFQKWEEALNPTEHRHTDAAETLEIMPWLRLATQSDPHNIEAYLVAVYWLNGDCNRPDLALEVIEEALKNNPDRYEIYLEKGRTLLSNDHLDLAEKAFQKTLTLLTENHQDDPEQVAIDLSLILTVQTYLYEVQGSREQAISAATQHLQLHPNQQNSAARLAFLQSQPLNPDAAKSRLSELFSNTYVCAGEEHVHGENCGCSQPEEEHVHSEHCEHEKLDPEPAPVHVHGPTCNHG